MTFSDALASVKAGALISREGWNGKNQWVQLQSPDANSRMTLSYLFIRTIQGDLVPWSASQTDLLANDWLATPTGSAKE